MDLFEQEYPEISKLYCHFINTAEYLEHKIVKAVDKQSSIFLDEVMGKSVFNADKQTRIEVEDDLLHLAVDYEQGGFILGFSYALNLIKESGVLKEFVQ